jgi:XTP/dITP diphosphohydrolase
MSFMSTKLYLASANPHKIRELQELVRTAEVAFEVLSAAEVGGMPDVAEDTDTFVGNARKKATALKTLLPSGAWALADDSGICVDALDGAPGVESAYFAGPEGDDRANLDKLVESMRGVPAESRGAHYVCVLILISPENQEYVFEAKCAGTLADEPEGIEGFGYDPLFIPHGYSQTLGILSPETKQKLSHRGKAWAELVAWSHNQEVS